MTDLVKRMKARVAQWRNEELETDWWAYQYEYAAAADYIKKLEADNARLREALEEFVASTGVSDDPDVLLVDALVYENAMRVLGLQK